MSESCKGMTLGGSAGCAGPASPGHSESDAPARRIDTGTVRLIENWIVAVVTVLSAGVILITLLAGRDVGGRIDAPAPPPLEASR